MASKVKICNFALSHLGARQIESLTDATKEARKCNLIFDQVRDTVLEDHDWSFARRRGTLALLPDTYTGWDLAYQYPSDCLSFRKILDNSTRRKVEFEMLANDDLNKRIILTDQVTAEGEYTARVTNPEMFSALFVSALSWRLAADLAYSLKASLKLKETMLNEYVQVLSIAKTRNANEGRKQPENINELTEARK